MTGAVQAQARIHEDRRLHEQVPFSKTAGNISDDFACALQPELLCEVLCWI